ncbi:MAG TPA: hypothetical protein VF432_12280 [Thermoanaerobaculia bacterium]
MRSRVLLLLVAAFAAFSVHAADLAGSNVLVPVAGRTNGAFGSQWQTDLVVTNLDAEPVPLVLTYYGAGGERVFTTSTLWGHGTISLEDVLFRAFRVSEGTGMIRVSSAREGARVTARAYVVNRGAESEYGQGVPGVPVDALATEHVLSGIVANDARRTNLGISNPWLVPASVTLTLHGPAGQQLGQVHRIVPALEVLRINDAFAAFGVEPVAEASVRVVSQVGVYAYASIIRNDSGDAIFVPGTGLGAQPVADVAPRCAEPASLAGARKGGGQVQNREWVVIMTPETTVDYMMNVLPQQHGYSIMDVYDQLPAFAAELTPKQLAALRCEASVLFIQQNETQEP